MKLELSGRNMKVRNVNFHNEIHGDDQKVIVVGLAVNAQVSAEELDQFFDGRSFKDAFYNDEDKLAIIGIGAISPNINLQGYIVDLNWSHDPDAGKRIPDAKINKFSIQPGLTAGSITISFRIQFVPHNDEIGHWCYDGQPYENWTIGINGPAQEDLADAEAA